MLVFVQKQHDTDLAYVALQFSYPFGAVTQYVIRKTVPISRATAFMELDLAAAAGSKWDQQRLPTFRLTLVQPALNSGAVSPLFKSPSTLLFL